MPLFQYKAATAGGEVLEGQMEAASQAAVIKRLQSQGQIPIRAEEISPAAARAAAATPWWQRRRVGSKDIAVFTLELATLLQAGLSLDRALEILSGLSDNEALREAVADIQTRVRGGASLSDAMEARKGLFSRFYLNMVRAGEAGGALDMALARLADFMERSREVRETVTSALIYPLILVAIAILSIVVILGFVVPRFAVMFEDAGQELPLATQIVVAAGDFVAAYWWLVIVVIGAAVWGVRRWLRNPKARFAWDRRMLRIPLLGDLIAKLEVARFSRTLGALLGNGVQLLNAITISKEIVGNQAIARAVGGLPASVSEGKGLARPLLEAEGFPALAGHMLQVGEETGNLESMLLRLADIYDREVQAALKKLLALVEPALILGLGVVIAGIIMSIVVAILRVNTLAF